MPTYALAQKWQVLVGLSPSYNIRSQSEIETSNNNPKQLESKNTGDASAVVELIYRPHAHVFLGGAVGFGYHSYRPLYLSNYEQLGYSDIVFNYLDPQAHPYLKTGINAGYSLAKSKYRLDFGLGVTLEPGVDNGFSEFELFRYDVNQVKQRVVKTTKTYRNDPQIYQTIFTRLFIKNSQRKFLNHLVIGLGYNNKFFNRKSSSIIHAVYTKADKTTYTNNYFDHKKSLYLSFQYRIGLK